MLEPGIFQEVCAAAPKDECGIPPISREGRGISSPPFSVRASTPTAEMRDAISSTMIAAGHGFYRDSLELLNRAKFPYLVGGAFALHHYTGIARYTKDLDLFLKPEDCARALDLFATAGYRVELTDKLWLGKIFRGDKFIDLIFRSGNGIAEVDDGWFDYAAKGSVLGADVQLCPVEETIWSKAFTMERERFDGADINHLILACGTALDWERLVARFDRHWRVLLSYIVLFGYSYPGEAHCIPARVSRELMARLGAELPDEALTERARVCQGTFLSRTQYRVDVEAWGFEDGRGNLVAQRATEDEQACAACKEKHS